MSYASDLKSFKTQKMNIISIYFTLAETYTVRERAAENPSRLLRGHRQVNITLVLFIRKIQVFIRLGLVSLVSFSSRRRNYTSVGSNGKCKKKKRYKNRACICDSCKKGHGRAIMQYGFKHFR